MQPKIGVLGVSDRAGMQRQLRAWIDQNSLLAASFSVATLHSAAALIAELRPGVTVWDLGVEEQRAGPASSGLLLARRVSRVVVLASLASDALLRQLLALGVMGCVEYQDAPAMLCTAVSAVHRGELWLPRRVLSAAWLEMNLLHAGCADQQALSMREREVRVWVSHGLMNKEIAQRMGISDKTVKTHLQRIFKKTGVHHRSQLAAHVAAGPAHAD